MEIKKIMFVSCLGTGDLKNGMNLSEYIAYFL